MDHSGRGRVVVLGGTGLVGRAVIRCLLPLGHKVTVVSRQPALPPSLQASAITSAAWQDLPAVLDGSAAVLNLAGESIAGGRWSPERKEQLRHSRLESVRRVEEALRRVSNRPPVLIQASAIGYYGASSLPPVDEQTRPGKGFLADLVRDWEAAVDGAGTQGLRVVKLRLGMVLSREGGALPRLVAPVRAFAGCSLGSGAQGMSWIHIQDVVGLVLLALEDARIQGILNATAPECLSHRDFMSTLAKHLHRPLWPIPAALTTPVVRAMLGEAAEALVLTGSYVRPRRALDLGYAFAYPTLREALRNLLP